jgi:uncharacterized damage-inducible protein DinB
MARIARPDAQEFVPYYGKYISRVQGDDAGAALQNQLPDSLKLLTPLDDQRALHRYAEGKWSIKEMVGHLADAERVFAYRAMRFGRADGTALPGFDENAYVPAGRFDRRPLADLLDEWKAVRAGSIALFRSFEDDDLVRMGNASNAPVSVRALAWIICGHELHHRSLLLDRYGLSA